MNTSTTCSAISMQCPQCKNANSQVIDSRDVQEGIRRRRVCLGCKHRFTTYERIEVPSVVVLKKNGGRERFQPEKVRRGLQIACKNRPVTSCQVDDLVNEVEQRVLFSGKDEITSHEIGEHVRELLKELDEVSYIRFVSVYREFTDAGDFAETIKTLN